MLDPAPLTKSDALKELNSLWQTYALRRKALSGVAGNQISGDQRRAFREQQPDLRDEIQVAIAFYNEAARAEESTENGKLQKTLKLWAIVVGVATLIQTLIAIANFIKDLCHHA